MLNVVISAIEATHRPQNGYLSQCARLHIKDHTVWRIPDVRKYSLVLASLKDHYLPTASQKNYNVCFSTSVSVKFPTQNCSFSCDSQHKLNLEIKQRQIFPVGSRKQNLRVILQLTRFCPVTIYCNCIQTLRHRWHISHRVPGIFTVLIYPKKAVRPLPE